MVNVCLTMQPRADSCVRLRTKVGKSSIMKKFLMTIALVLSGTTVAQAAETVYGTRGAFNAATTGQAVDTFGTAAGSTYVGASAYVRSGYQITTNDAWLFNNNPSVTNSYYNWGTGNVMTFKQNGVVTFTFDTAITAFGIDLGAFWQDFPSPTVYSFSVGVATPSAEINVVTGPTQSLSFFGLTSTAGFTSITLYGGANNFTVFDNVTLATAATAAVPEPATWALMMLGFGLIGASLRSRRTKVAFAA